MGQVTFGTSFSHEVDLDLVWVESGYRTPSERFSEVARMYPDSQALLGRGGLETDAVTYRELDEKASRVANAVTARTTPRAHVAVLVDDPVEHLAAVLGAQRADRTVVPLDRSNPPARLEYILQHSNSSLLLVEDNAEQWAAMMPVIAISEADVESAEYDGPSPSPESIAQICYTSGSSGRPKGVMQSNQYLMQKTRWATAFYGITAQDRLSQLFPLSFAASNGHTYGALLNGGTLCPYPLSTGGVHHLPGWVQDLKITGLAMVPTLFRRALAHQADPSMFESVRYVMIGGELGLAGDHQLFENSFPAESVLVHRLAATEVGAIAEHVIRKGQPVVEGPLPSGFASGKKQLLIVDADGKELPQGEVGELWIKGKDLSEGYWEDHELTASKVIADGDYKTYRTGDYASLNDDGELIHLGRMDGRIKVRGNGVDLVEVERAFLSLPGIDEGAVKAFSNDEGDNQLIAYFTSGPPVDTRALRRMFQSHVPDYMVPARFIQLAELPLTPRGKIDRSALDEPIIEPSEATDMAGPASELEERLHGIWAGVLGMTTVPVNESFFDLGGNSAGAYQLIADIYHQLDVDFPATSMLEAPTIRQQAALIESGGRRGARALVSIRPGTSSRRMFGVHGQQGGILYLSKLVETLDKSYSIYGLQPPFDPDEPPQYKTVEEVAASYVDEIKTVQPSGPYALMGHCFGGLVAREMARLLDERGESVGLLISIDPPTPGDRVVPQQRWTLMRIRRGLKSRLKKLVGSMKRSVRRVTTPGVDLRRAQIKANSKRARSVYEPVASTVPLVLISAQDSIERHDARWRSVSAGGLEIIPIQAYHFEMLHPPNRANVADVMEKKLDEVDWGRDSSS